MWLEINGEAWIYGNKENFQFELDHSKGNNRISDEVFQAIGVLIKNKIADKRLWKIYCIEYEIRELRKIMVDVVVKNLGQ